MANGKRAVHHTQAVGGAKAKAQVGPPDPVQRKVGQAVAKIRKYYDLGKKVQNTTGEGQGYDGKTIAEAAARLGTEGDSVRKAREFARAYTPTQLEELCGLRTKGGMPLTWCHVRWLIQVKDPAARSGLQIRAASESWSTRELGAAVQRLHGGKSSPGGRAIAVPPTQRPRAGSWSNRPGSGSASTRRTAAPGRKCSVSSSAAPNWAHVGRTD